MTKLLFTLSIVLLFLKLQNIVVLSWDQVCYPIIAWGIWEFLKSIVKAFIKGFVQGVEKHIKDEK